MERIYCRIRGIATITERIRQNSIDITSATVIIIVLALIAGCSTNTPLMHKTAEVSRHPQTQWNPPEKVIESQQTFQTKVDEAKKKTSVIPKEILDNIKNLGLSDIVDIALLNSKQTYQAWSQARAAAAMYGSERGSFLPDVNATISGNNQKNAAYGGRVSSGVSSYTANASLSWLLFDFGGRRASVEAAHQALYAADWYHNVAIQNVILQVEQAYYDYFAAKALLAAQQATVDESRTNLTAAEDRHTAGIATISDVLQAKTALSQATLALQTLQGRIMITRGMLATAMGLPANTEFDVELPVDAPPLEKTKKSVDEYLETASRARPDLAAARAQAIAAEARLRAVRSQGLPSISANGSMGRLYFDNLTNGNDIYNATIGLNIPLFRGFSQRYNEISARAQADAASANAQNIQDIVTLQVWTSYYDLETADQRVRTSEDLLASATENYEVAAGRYKSGVGSILDLLTAQAALENARAQQILARADWWTSVAQLAHDTGTLEANPPDNKGSGQNIESKEGK